MRDAVQYEKGMNEFFMSVKAAIMADDKRLKKWSDSEKESVFYVLYSESWPK